MDANIKAKQLEAEKYDLIAERMRKLNYETNELASGFGELSDAADKAASSADKAANSYDGLASSIRSADKAKSEFATNTRGEVITTGTDVQRLATQNSTSPEGAKVFEELFTYYFNKELADPQNRSSTMGVSYGAAEAKAIEAARAEAQRRSQQSATSNGNFWGTRNTYTVDLRTSTGTKSVQVADQSSADTLIATLQELATRS